MIGRTSSTLGTTLDGIVSRVGTGIQRNFEETRFKVKGPPGLAVEVRRREDRVHVIGIPRARRAVASQLGTDSAPWELLKASSRLAGNLRYALSRDGKSVVLMGDFSAGDESGDDPGLVPLLDGMQDGARHLTGKSTALLAAVSPSRDAQLTLLDTDAAEVAPLLAETGWPYSERNPQRAAVEIGESHGLRCIVESTPGGFLRCSLQIAQIPEPIALTCQRAIGQFLLGLNGRLRMARAAVHQSEASTEIVIESTFSSTPTAPALSDAIAAAAVAAPVTARETRELLSEERAGLFLSLQRTTAFPAPKSVSFA